MCRSCICGAEAVHLLEWWTSRERGYSFSSSQLRSERQGKLNDPFVNQLINRFMPFAVKIPRCRSASWGKTNAHTVRWSLFWFNQQPFKQNACWINTKHSASHSLLSSFLFSFVPAFTPGPVMQPLNAAQHWEEFMENTLAASSAVLDEMWWGVV